MIIISPYSKPLRNGNRNPKNYPYWKELIVLISGNGFEEIVQIGTDGEEKIEGAEYFAKNTPFEILVEKLKDAILILSVDNFLPHFAHYYKQQCVVLFGQSDPNLFGYEINFNLLKNRKYLRPNQFDIWEGVEYKEEAFLSAEEVFEQIKPLL